MIRSSGSWPAPAGLTEEGRVPARAVWVNVAGSSSPSNVWAASESRNGKGPRLNRWDGRKRTPGEVFQHQGSFTAMSVLGKARSLGR